VPSYRSGRLRLAAASQKVRAPLEVADYAYVLQAGNMFIHGRAAEPSETAVMREANLGTNISSSVRVSARERGNGYTYPFATRREVLGKCFALQAFSSGSPHLRFTRPMRQLERYRRFASQLITDFRDD
jgi:hypothetical protein